METLAVISLATGAILSIAAVATLIYNLTKNKVVTDMTISKSEEKHKQVDKNEDAISEHEGRIAALEAGQEKQFKLLREMREETRRADDLIKETLHKILNALIDGSDKEELKKTRDGMIRANTRS